MWIQKMNYLTYLYDEVLNFSSHRDRKKKYLLVLDAYSHPDLCKHMRSGTNEHASVPLEHLHKLHFCCCDKLTKNLIKDERLCREDTNAAVQGS